METSRGSALLNVVTTDLIYCNLHAFSTYEGNSNYQIYFVRFLYKSSLFTQIAWCVGRSGSYLFGPADYVQLDAINVNTGSAWNATTNYVNISVPGVYIVDLTGFLSCLVASGNGDEHLQLLLNGISLIELKLMGYTANGITRSRSVAV